MMITIAEIETSRLAIQAEKKKKQQKKNDTGADGDTAEAMTVDYMKDLKDIAASLPPPLKGKPVQDKRVQSRRGRTHTL